MKRRNDKLFQKRKALQKSVLERRKHSREKRRRMLIVCEGEVTEPTYFEHLRQYLGLTSVDVDICGDCDSSPLDVVKYAKSRAEVEGSWQAGGYDQIYCVFDRDAHDTFEKALSFIQNLKKSKKFPAKKIDHVCSFPCFEYWLLLHFTFTRCPFVKTGDRSPCAMVIEALEDASKEDGIGKRLNKPFLDKLLERREGAIVNAKKAANDVKATGESNPSTSVHLIIGDLVTLKNEI